MTDSEMTALAAQAYGDAPTTFSPLTDDGDALRLAAGLIFTIHQHEISAVRPAGIVEAGRRNCWEMELFQSEDQRQQATRRAIVRAAVTMQLAKENPE